MTSPATPRKPAPTGRLTIVQCCHIPHFFFAAERLRQQFPDLELDALLVDHPQVREYLPFFPPFDHTYFWNARKQHWVPSAPPESATLELVFPLLTRGYRRIKKAASRLSHARFWEMDYEGSLVPLDHGRLDRSAWFAVHQATADFASYLGKFPHRPLGDRVLVIHSADESLIESSRETWERLLPPRAEVEHLETFRFSDWRRFRLRRPDAAIVFLSGERGYRRLKLAPLLLGMRQVLAINENGHAFYVDSRTLARFLYHRLRRGVTAPRRRPGVLFIHSESRRHSNHALQQLRDQSLFPRGEIAVLCPDKDRAHFKSLPEVDLVFSYSDQLTELWPVYRQILRFSPDVVSAIFSGRRGFWKARVLFLLLADRRRLVFNAHLDCYWLSLRTLPFLLRSEPVLYEENRATPWAGQSSETLLIQTESSSMTAAAIERLASRKVSGGRPVSVLCSADKVRHFENLPQVVRVHAYRPSDWMDQAKLLRRLWRTDREIVAAVYSGRPIFRLQKLLLLLLPARNRLVFNENLDCSYLRRSRVLSLVRIPELTSRIPRRSFWVATWGIAFLRVALYLPRFAFLAGWLTWEKFKRARYFEARGESEPHRVGAARHHS